MVTIEAREDENQASECVKVVRCPRCRQVLADIRKVKGCGTIRLKCRRCGTYTLVDIIGT